MTATCPVGGIPIRPHRTPPATLRSELSSLSYSSDLHLPQIELRSCPPHPAAPPIHPLADGPRRTHIRTSAATCQQGDPSFPQLRLQDRAVEIIYPPRRTANHGQPIRSCGGISRDAVGLDVNIRQQGGEVSAGALVELLLVTRTVDPPPRFWSLQICSASAAIRRLAAYELIVAALAAYCLLEAVVGPAPQRPPLGTSRCIRRGPDGKPRFRSHSSGTASVRQRTSKAGRHQS